MNGGAVFFLLLASAGLLGLALALLLIRWRPRPASPPGPPEPAKGESMPEGAAAEMSREEERARLKALWQHFARRLR
ncbi:MAG: hypothetical protein ACP5NB_10100 [Chloroflexia bacterium]